MVTKEDLAWLREEIAYYERDSLDHDLSSIRRGVLKIKLERLQRIEADLLAQKQEPVATQTRYKLADGIWSDWREGGAILPSEFDGEKETRKLYAASPAPAVTVKALEWKGNYGKSPVCGNLCYRISYNVNGSPWGYRERGDGYYTEIDNGSGSLVAGPFPSPDQAKAAAQADYERLILSAITPQQPNEELPECPTLK